jgi:hypothetical protein
MAGNSMAGNYTFNFTTGASSDVTLPTTGTANPLNNATDVARNKAVAITFSEAMNPLTLTTSTFTLMQGTTLVPSSNAC